MGVGVGVAMSRLTKSKHPPSLRCLPGSFAFDEGP